MILRDRGDGAVIGAEGDAMLEGAEREDRSLLQVCNEQLELKELLLESTLDGIMAYTTNGELAYFNAAAADLLGYSPLELAGLTDFAWLAPEVRLAAPVRIAHMREYGSIRYQARVLSASGRQLHTEVHSRIVDSIHGEVVVSVIRDITDRVLAEETIRHLAFHDTLTGLANRTLLEERLHQALASADRHGDTVGVVYLDLDDFKPVNDSLGHAMGDRVLRMVAERMLSCVRESDTVARLGGDEFLVLFPRLCRECDLAETARKVVECLSEPMEVEGHTVRVTASAGLALYTPGEAPDELVTRADHAMYRAKQNGLAGWEEFLAR